MCSLVADAKDMSPYVPILLPDIQKSLVDVSPEVRATAAAALASLLQGMGGAEAEQFSEVIPWLTRTLQSDGASTERSGAAQGLAECLAVLGPETFEAMLPEIFAGCAHVAPHVREGHLTLLRFLPLALGAAFEAHLKEALSEVLTGLADISEPVRHAALGAGARLRGGVLAQRPQPGPAAARDRGGAGPRELAHPRERDGASGEHDVPHRRNEREGARGGRGRRRGHLHRGAGRVAHVGRSARRDTTTCWRRCTRCDRTRSWRCGTPPCTSGRRSSRTRRGRSE
jgi:hypothetical protein